MTVVFGFQIVFGTQMLFSYSRVHVQISGSGTEFAIQHFVDDSGFGVHKSLLIVEFKYP